MPEQISTQARDEQLMQTQSDRMALLEQILETREAQPFPSQNQTQPERNTSGLFFSSSSINLP